MNLFQVVPDSFFKILTGKYKAMFIDCLQLLYHTYKTELSFGVDKDIVVYELERYFESTTEDLTFDDNENEIARGARDKANAVLRRLKESGWIEFEVANDYKVKVNMYDYSTTMIESFNAIVKKEEMEFQSLVSQIHATLLHEEGYQKPYEYIIKRVIENTEELMLGLKKLNTNIKKHIDAITTEKSAGEIIQDFFVYHKEIGSKAYHRIKTSDNISYFRAAIHQKLYTILQDTSLFEKATQGFMEIESVKEKTEAQELLRNRIQTVIQAFRKYDDIVSEIDAKHAKYIGNAVSRAKFLLTHSNTAEGKLMSVLRYLSDKYNAELAPVLLEELDDEMLTLFSIFPQGFIDNESLYVMPISKKMPIPDVLNNTLSISEEERAIRRLALQEKNKNRFSRKNIFTYVNELLHENSTIRASSLPIQTKRDGIRLIFIYLYGRDKQSKYKVTPLDHKVMMSGFGFRDFVIERCDETNGSMERKSNTER